jgi:hypothetical protein
LIWLLKSGAKIIISPFFASIFVKLFSKTPIHEGNDTFFSFFGAGKEGLSASGHYLAERRSM